MAGRGCFAIAIVGTGVGINVGAGVGMMVGTGVGIGVGADVGAGVGMMVGTGVGTNVTVGDIAGTNVGFAVGFGISLEVDSGALAVDGPASSDSRIINQYTRIKTTTIKIAATAINNIGPPRLFRRSFTLVSLITPS